MNIKDLSKEELQNILDTCVTISDFCRKLGLKPGGGNHLKVKKLISDQGLDDSKLEGIHWKKGKSVKGVKHRELKNILKENSPYSNYTALKKRLYAEGLKDPKCEVCSKTIEEVTLELHHKNGNPLDNRLENLQILCPNCHSKTPNWRGKSRKEGKILPSRTHESGIDTVLSLDEVEARKEARKQAKRKPKADENKLTITQTPQTCQYCNNPFFSRRLQRFCSRDCYEQSTASKARPGCFELISRLKELKSFTAVGKFYGVTDNAVRKWCRLYKISDKSEDYR